MIATTYSVMLYGELAVHHHGQAPWWRTKSTTRKPGLLPHSGLAIVIRRSLHSFARQHRIPSSLRESFSDSL
jgi:hypothetical protein